MDTLSEKSPNQGENPYPNDERYSTKTSPSSSASSGASPPSSSDSASAASVASSVQSSLLKQDHSSILQINGNQGNHSTNLSGDSAKQIATTKPVNNIPAHVVQVGSTSKPTPNCPTSTLTSLETGCGGSNGGNPILVSGSGSGGGIASEIIQIQETQSLTSTSPIPPAGASIETSSGGTHMVNGHSNGGGGVTVS